MNRYKLVKAGIDVNDALCRLNNDKALYEELLQEFVQDEHYTLLCAALEAKNIHAAFEEAHALKGIAGNLSLTRLHAALVPFVAELHHSCLEPAELLFPPVAESYQELLAALSKNESESEK